MRRALALGAVALATVAVAAVTAIGLGGGGGSPRGRAPAQRRGAPRRYAPYRRPVPVLMYHVVESPPPGAPNPALYVSAQTFAAQMDWLARHGYRALTLARLVDAWHGRAPVPRKPIVLSFDDGYRSDYTNALPVLRRHHWPGVLNFVLSTFKDPSGIDAAQVRALIRAGWELASHTLSHLDLTTLHGWRLRREVRDSRLIFERRFGVPVRDFAYPAGRYDAEVVAAVRRAGYRAAVTTDPGLAVPSEPLTLKRLRVEESDGPSLAKELGSA